MESVFVLREPVHDLVGAFSLLAGYVELAVTRPQNMPLAKLETELARSRHRWDVAHSRIREAFARARTSSTEPELLPVDDAWKRRALEAEDLLHDIEAQADRWMTASTACAVGAGQTIKHILQKNHAA